MPGFLVNGICNHSVVSPVHGSVNGGIETFEGMLSGRSRNLAYFDGSWERKINDQISWERQVEVGCDLRKVLGAADNLEILAGWIGEDLESQFRAYAGGIALGDDEWGWHGDSLVNVFRESGQSHHGAGRGSGVERDEGAPFVGIFTISAIAHGADGGDMADNVAKGI